VRHGWQWSGGRAGGRADRVLYTRLVRPLLRDVHVDELGLPRVHRLDELPDMLVVDVEHNLPL
jgi:hypothetical protein